MNGGWYVRANITRVHIYTYRLVYNIILQISGKAINFTSPSAAQRSRVRRETIILRCIVPRDIIVMVLIKKIIYRRV